MKGEFGSYDSWSNLAAKKQKRVDAKADPQAGIRPAEGGLLDPIAREPIKYVVVMSLLFLFCLPRRVARSHSTVSSFSPIDLLYNAVIQVSPRNGARKWPTLSENKQRSGTPGLVRPCEESCVRFPLILVVPLDAMYGDVM